MAIGTKSVLAIIPARGGSKRFPGKNLALFHGKPLVEIAVEQALSSAYIDRIIVSSDSDEILSRVPVHLRLKRPPRLSGDTATSESAVLHALQIFRHFDYFVLLQPTSPLRTVGDIDQAIRYAATFPAGKSCTTAEGSTSPNGAVYACRTSLFLANPLLPLSKYAHPSPMPASRSLDINYPQDLPA